MKIEKILVKVKNHDEPINIVDLKKEDYESFLELMHQLRVGYNSIINSKS